MGNCSLKGVAGVSPNGVRVLDDSGDFVEFNGPIMAKNVLENYPGYDIFRQGHTASPLQESEYLIATELYYLLPIQANDKQIMSCNNAATTRGQVNEEASPKTKPSDSMLNGPAVQALPSTGDGVWRVKLVIDTKQLEEILSGVNTEALIERMRMTATSKAPNVTRRSITSWGVTNLKPVLSNVLKIK